RRSSVRRQERTREPRGGAGMSITCCFLSPRWGDALQADVEAPAKEQSSDAAVRVAEEGAAHPWLVNGIQDVRCRKSEPHRRRVRHGGMDLCEDRVDIS